MSVDPDEAAAAMAPTLEVADGLRRTRGEWGKMFDEAPAEWQEVYAECDRRDPKMKEKP